MKTFGFVSLAALALTCMSIPSTAEAKEPVNTTLIGNKAINARSDTAAGTRPANGH